MGMLKLSADVPWPCRACRHTRQDETVSGRNSYAGLPGFLRAPVETIRTRQSLTSADGFVRQLSRMRQCHRHAEAAMFDNLNTQIWTESMGRYSA